MTVSFATMMMLFSSVVMNDDFCLVRLGYYGMTFRGCEISAHRAELWLSRPGLAVWHTTAQQAPTENKQSCRTGSAGLLESSTYPGFQQVQFLWRKSRNVYLSVQCLHQCPSSRYRASRTWGTALAWRAAWPLRHLMSSGDGQTKRKSAT